MSRRIITPSSVGLFWLSQVDGHSAAAPLLCVGRSDVLVETEQVVRVVPVLDRDQSLIGRGRVRGPHLVRAALAGEVHVRLAGAERAGNGSGPVSYGVEVFHRRRARDDVDDEVLVPGGERG